MKPPPGFGQCLSLASRRAGRAPSCPQDGWPRGASEWEHASLFLMKLWRPHGTPSHTVLKTERTLESPPVLSPGLGYIRRHSDASMSNAAQLAYEDREITAGRRDSSATVQLEDLAGEPRSNVKSLRRHLPGRGS